MKKLYLLFLYSYLVLFPFGQLIRIPPQSATELREVHFYLTDLAAAGLTLICAVSILIKKKKTFPPLFKPILLFAGAALLSLLVNFRNFELHQVYVSALYLLRWLAYAGVYFSIFELKNLMIKTEWELYAAKFKRFLINVGVVSAIFGLIQYLIIPDTRFLAQYGWDDHYFRVIGTFFDPGFLGAVYVLTLILITVGFRKSLRAVVTWIIVYLALALTYSRASYVAYVVGMGLIAFSRRSIKLFMGMLALLLVTLVLLPRPGGEGVKLTRDSTIKLRIINWGQSLSIIKDNPVIGVGFNTYRYVQQKYGYLDSNREKYSHAGAGADSSILFIWATTGIVGLIAYFNLAGKIALSGNLAVIISLAVVLVHSQFSNTLFYPWIMGWFWILIGISEKRSVKN